MRLPSTLTPPTNNNSSCSDGDDEKQEVKEDEATSVKTTGAKDIHVNSNMREVDYSEYEWMEHIEEFDREVIRELEEQAFYEQCFLEMSEDSEDGYCDLDDLEYDLEEDYEALGFDIIPLDIQINDEQVLFTPLNPSAPEFVPKSFTLNGDEREG